MLKQIMINKKLDLRKASLTEIDVSLAELLESKEALERAVDEIKEDEELETVEEEVKALEEKKEELEEEKTKLEEEIAALEEELEELNRNKPVEPGEKEEKRGDKKMSKLERMNQAIASYVRNRNFDQLRADGEAEDDGVVGFKIVDGGVLVPDEVLAAYKKPVDKVDLSKLVNVVKVNRGSGSYPIIAQSGATMSSVAELEANPELAKPSITKVDYTVETYRGYVPISQEVIDDAEFNVAKLVAEEIDNQELNTKNAKIAAVLKTATAKSVEGVDGLKAVYNVSLPQAYGRKAIITASLFNELDTTKDNNGRYLLQDDITVASGKRLFGHEVVVLDDKMIGAKANDLKGFIGDPDAFCTLFDRKRASAKWVDHNVYGELLAIFSRFQAKKVDADAGFYITYTPETEEVVTP